MRVNAKLCPVVQFFLDDLPRAFRHQTERVAREINHRLAVIPERQRKFFTEAAQRILRIELSRETFVSGELHRYHDSRPPNALSWRINDE